MPLFDLKELDSCSTVAVWQITETVEELCALVDVPDSDKEKLETFKLDKRKQEWLATRVLLNKLLGFYPQIKYGENGKPFLGNSSYKISISHTKGYAAVCMSKHPTAIDIEIPSQRVNKISKRFVHPKEEAFIDDASRIKYLTILWSAKEALYKYYNIFGVEFKEQFLIYPFKLNDSRLLECNFTHNSVVHELQLRYELNEYYCIVYCC